MFVTIITPYGVQYNIIYLYQRFYNLTNEKKVSPLPRIEIV